MATATTLADLRDGLLAGGEIIVPKGVDISTDESLLAPVPNTSLCGGGTIRTSVRDIDLIYGTADNFKIEGLTLVGPGATKASYRECGVRIRGASAARPVRGFRLLGCTLRDWGFYGANVEQAADVELVGCTFDTIHYAAFMGVSVLGGKALGNRGANVYGEAGKNSYFLAVTSLDRPAGSPLTLEEWFALNPRSRDFEMAGNDVDGVPNWTAYDTHAGVGITIRGNRCRNVRNPVGVGRLSNAGVSAAAVSITGNDLGGIPGGDKPGISIDSLAEPVTGEVSGNTLDGCGNPAKDDTGAIMVYGTADMPVRGNTLKNSGAVGICVFHHNANIEVAGNLIDGLNAAGVGPVGVYVRAFPNTGRVAANTVTGGPAVKVTSNPGNVITLV